MDNLIEKFKNPTTDNRSAPFWSWNDDLDPQELKRQVRDMKAHGIGGFFMHSREGLETEYMGEDWLECIRETVKEAAKNDMKAWLYDEDRWPSGFAGGLIAEEIGDAGRAKLLVMDKVESGEVVVEEEIQAAFAVNLEQETLKDIKQINRNNEYQLTEDETGLLFKRKITEPSPWFNGDSYGDNLNPDSVRKFIEITYEAYREEIGDEFGETVPGIFTDEPNIYSHHHPNMQGLPWTDILPEYFKEHRGYDLLPNLPYIFLDGEKSHKIRHDFWLTLTELFCEAYTEQLGEWCDEQGIALTGHFLLENEFAHAIRTTGAIMPHYQYMAAPGIDILTESIRETLTVKQCSSVAHQFGRKKVLSELYGCTGWEFDFTGQKWVGDWQYALGVNYRCQHLTLYSIKGCRKRDYPPSFNYNNTWWKYNNIVENYFGRLSTLLTEGEAVRDLLVLHPIGSAWADFNGSNLESINQMGYEFQDFVEVLLSHHRDFDLGDEMIMADYGSVSGTTLQVKQADYKVVVMPPMTTIRQTTVDLLTEFVNNGGKVVACTPLPSMIDGEVNQQIQDLFAEDNVFVIENRNKLEDVLSCLITREIYIRNSAGEEDESIIYQQRTVGERELYYLVNTDRDSAHEVRLKFNASGKVEQWHPLTGDIEEVTVSKENGRVKFNDKLEPAGSRVFVIDRSQEPKLDEEIELISERSQYIGSSCEFTRTNPNVLTLDYCQYKMGEGQWSEKKQIWRAQKEIREELDMRAIYTNGIEQRWRWVNQPHENDGQPVTFKFEFEVDVIPGTPLYLVIENVEDFQIRFNGEKIAAESSGWFLDRSFDKVELGTPTQGKNEITLYCEYENRMEVEDCYVIGDFAVDTETRSLIAEPESLHFGDWCLQGYYHYAGSIIYKDQLEFNLSDNEKVYIHLKEHEAITTEIRVNGETAGHIPWAQADGLDITDQIKEGLNEFEIEVMGSPRNMLGPLHQKAGRSPATSAASFRTTGDNYTPDYVLQPYGLFDQVELKIKKEE